jgi:hypothetical protein
MARVAHFCPSEAKNRVSQEKILLRPKKFLRRNFHLVRPIGLLRTHAIDARTMPPKSRCDINHHAPHSRSHPASMMKRASMHPVKPQAVTSPSMESFAALRETRRDAQAVSTLAET